MEQQSYNERRIYSLTEVAQSLRSVIEQNYIRDFYVKAEVSKLNYYPHSGHCYPDLVEKNGTKVMAQMRATIWAGDFKKISQKFVEVTGNELGDGLQVLCLATMNFHPTYGLALHIKDVIPEYSLGEMAKSKQETIIRLKEEGVFDANKSLVFPLLPKHIAVISVSTSKGYEDFMSILATNKYPLNTYLFPALLQGDGAVVSISYQLKRLLELKDYLDAVVIVRGGGGDVGLSAYDNYELVNLIANYPIPVVTGIGHSTNVTVSEMVAYYAAITPTDTANFFLDKINSYAESLYNFGEIIRFYTVQKLLQERQGLKDMISDVKAITQTIVKENHYQLLNFKNTLQFSTQATLKQHVHELDVIREKLKLLDPERILERGYSITMKDGKIVKNAKDLNPDDIIEHFFAKGRAESKVTKITKK